MQSYKMLGAAAIALLMAGAANAQDKMLDNTPMFDSGEQAYNQVCARCHTGAETTVGPDLFTGAHDRDSLEYFVRNGSGPMPAFTKSMIDDATLDSMAAYVIEQSKGAE